MLLFLLFDVLSHANESVEEALTGAVNADGTWARFVGLAAVFAAGVAIGLVGLVHYDRWRAGRRTPDATGWTVARRMAVLIATGIGLHNFAEGLAIGQSAASGEVTLALVLIIGFGLHNATEGFGIVAPLAAAAERPSWLFLAGLGLLGGGPTFLGTVIGRSFVDDVMFVAFLALAAGSILYVLIQLLRVAADQGHPEIVVWGIFIGLVLGFATDYVLVAAGG